MSQCLNFNCLKINPPQANYCQHCRAKLLLADRYRATSYLGEGGFGRTFKAIDQHRLNMPCVIKQFLPQHIESSALSKATKLFNQEAQRLNELGKHPQIPDLLAFFEQEERLYLIQEFIEGKNLLEELKQRGKFSKSDVRIMLDDLLKILEFVHNKNVVHRDIKPENIIRRTDGSLVLIDFGVSKHLGQSVLTKIGTVAGTPGYAAPEQMQGMVFPSSDLYSLGVTCIRLLTGKLPDFSNSSMTDELFDVMRMQWVWRNQISLKDEQLGRILDKMMVIIVGERFQSATEVRKELNSRQKPHSYPQIQLKSARGFNYSNLERLLKQKDWKASDKETAKKMLEVAGRTKEGWLRVKDIDDFPCEDLCIIDDLWVKYSNGQFGFSVQKQIYQDLGGTRKYDEEVWDNFGDAVGWRGLWDWLYYEDIIYSNKSWLEYGHFPCFVESGDGSGFRWLLWVVSGETEAIGAFFSRIEACGL